MSGLQVRFASLAQVTFSEMADIDALQHRLAEWARWTEAWQPKLGYPHRVPFIELMKPSLVHEGEGSDERIDAWAMGILDSSIESLPRLYNRAIYVFYLHRQPRTDMTTQAENYLIPIVIKKGLLLL